MADDSIDVSEEFKSDGLERDLTSTLRQKVWIVAMKTPGRWGSSFQFVDNKGGKVACGMFATTENTEEIAFVQMDVVAELGVEDTYRSFAGG